MPNSGHLQTNNQLTTPTNCGSQKLRARVLQFSSFLFLVPCARLSWPCRRFLSAHKYIVSYRTVPYRTVDLIYLINQINQILNKYYLLTYLFHRLCAQRLVVNLDRVLSSAATVFVTFSRLAEKNVSAMTYSMSIWT